MKLRWKQTAFNTDGSPFLKEKFAGWTLFVDAKPSIALPVQWQGDDADQEYEYDLAPLGLAKGVPHTLYLVTTDTDGDNSPPSEKVTFVDGIPTAPLIVGVV